MDYKREWYLKHYKFQHHLDCLGKVGLLWINSKLRGFTSTLLVVSSFAFDSRPIHLNKRKIHLIVFIVQISSFFCYNYKEAVSNSSPLISEFPWNTLSVLHEILFSLCNPNFYPIFPITETFYRWNLSVIRTKDFSPWDSD